MEELGYLKHKDKVCLHYDFEDINFKAVKAFNGTGIGQYSEKRKHKPD